MANKIDPKIRAIYHLMLVDEILVRDGSGHRFVWTYDEETAEEVISYSDETMGPLEIAKNIASVL
jgi:hypothetical protein